MKNFGVRNDEVRIKNKKEEDYKVLFFFVVSLIKIPLESM